MRHLDMYTTDELIAELKDRFRKRMGLPTLTGIKQRLFSSQEYNPNKDIDKPEVGMKVRSRSTGKIGEVIPSGSSEICIQFKHGRHSYFDWRHFWIENEVDRDFKPEKIVQLRN